MFKNIGQAGDNIIELALTASDGLTAGNKSLGFGGDKLHGASGFVRHAFATWAMGLFNIPFSLMQLLQVPMFAPQMAMITRKELGMDFTTGRASAMKAALSVTQYITAHAMGGPTTKRGQMVQAILGNHEKDPEMKVAWQYAEDNNLVNFTDIERTLDKTLNPKAAKIDRVLNMNQRYAEAMTRPMVFMWMFNLERAAGVPIKEALEIAKNKTQFVMVPYDSRDRPMMYASMGFYGQALGQLKTFMHSSITQQYYYFKVAKTKKMILPAAYTALIGILFQGQMGILGMQDIDNLTRAWNQSINGKNQGIKEVLADNVPIAVERGLLSDWSGVDFYSRLRSPGVIQWPLTNSLVPSSYNWAIDRTKNVLNGLDALTKVDLEKLEKATEFQKNLNQLVPPQFKWALEERYAGPNGEVQVYPKYGPPVDGYKRDDTDRILRRLGVRSTKEALFSEQHFDSMSDKFIYNEKKKEAGLKLREAYTKGYFTGKHVEELEEKFLAAGGTMKEMKQLMKGSMAPETVEDLYFGKPSKNRAPTLIDLYELRDNRKRE